jgi:hypothetical protein
MNGAVGIVRYLCYMHPNGPNPTEDEHDSGQYDSSIKYAIVEFPDCKIDESEKFFPDLPCTYVPIPIVTERCERKCCSVQALPLRCCKALNIHKSQGMTIGPDKPIKRAIVFFPDKNNGSRSTPGLELVATSRVTDLQYLAIGNPKNELSRELFATIGTSSAYDSRRAYLQDIKQRAETSKGLIEQKIAALDPSEDNKTYEGGCKFLLDWYNEVTSTNNNE